MKETCIAVVAGLIFFGMLFGMCAQQAQLQHECKINMAQQKYTASEIFVVCEAK